MVVKGGGCDDVEKSGGVGGGVLYPGVYGQVPTVRYIYVITNVGGDDGGRWCGSGGEEWGGGRWW